MRMGGEHQPPLRRSRERLPVTRRNGEPTFGIET